jgi:hypothetical protein
MNTPDPVPNGKKVNFVPNVSTVSSGVGGSIAIIVLAIVHQYMKVDITPELAVAVGAVCTFIAGYIPPSGRQSN